MIASETASPETPVVNMSTTSSVVIPPTPIIGISVFTFILWRIFGGEHALIYALVNAVAVLIVACPCALGLATPMSLTVGIAKGAKNGILIKMLKPLNKCIR